MRSTNLQPHNAIRLAGLSAALCLTCAFAPVWASPPSAEDVRAIQSLFQRYGEAVAANDLTALAGCYERDTPTLREWLRQNWKPLLSRAPQVTRSSEVLNVGVSGDAALVRERFQVFSKVSDASWQRLRRGTWDVLLRRVPPHPTSPARGEESVNSSPLAGGAGGGGEWRLTEQFWNVPDVEARLGATLNSNAQREPPGVLHLVLELRGGRWYPLRQLWWEGAIWGGSGRRAGVSTDELMPALTNVLQRYYERSEPLEVHLMIQRDQYGWILIGSTADAQGGDASPSERDLRVLRRRVLEDFASAAVHKQFADALYVAGAFAEAAAEYERAEALQPGLVGKTVLAAAQSKIALDPQAQIEKILEFEEKVGVAPDHPQVKIQQLSQAQRANQQRADIALQLGVELSRVGDEEGAVAQLRYAASLIQSGRGFANDADFTEKLMEHLQERVRLSLYKPPQTIRSPLFTVRFHPGDMRIFAVMAALERAQHIVYTSFGVPMSGTEVLLLRNQNAFQGYVSRFPDQSSSEFAQAVTISRSLVHIRTGAILLSTEEIITFSADGMDYFANLAHEYGHVAVRRFTGGSKQVPVWLHEGIACLVQGGYPDYRQRCQQANAAGQLLPMEVLLAWNVDGERAFLAYSEANAIVQFILTQRGSRALLQILDELRRSRSPDQAFVRTLNLTQAQLFQRWVATLRK